MRGVRAVRFEVGDSKRLIPESCYIRGVQTLRAWEPLVGEINTSPAQV